MSDKKEYLGDGVYADIDQWSGMIRLTTEDGIRVTNEIYIDSIVWKALTRWVEKMTNPPVVHVSLEDAEMIMNAVDGDVVEVENGGE